MRVSGNQYALVVELGGVGHNVLQRGPESNEFSRARGGEKTSRGGERDDGWWRRAAATFWWRGVCWFGYRSNVIKESGNGTTVIINGGIRPKLKVPRAARGQSRKCRFAPFSVSAVRVDAEDVTIKVDVGEVGELRRREGSDKG